MACDYVKKKKKESSLEMLTKVFMDEMVAEICFRITEHGGKCVK